MQYTAEHVIVHILHRLYSIVCPFHSSLDVLFSWTLPRTHLRDAGLKESGRFAVDQMAKWLSITAIPGPTAPRIQAIASLKKKCFKRFTPSHFSADRRGLHRQWPQLEHCRD